MILQVFVGSRRWRAIVKSFWKAYRLWDREDCVDLSAAFAYHSLQSFFPILLIALGVASLVLGRMDGLADQVIAFADCLLYTSPSPRDKRQSRMPSSA